jgi:hypothetical protein
MTYGEVINLIGIIVVLIATIVGWIISNRTQKELIGLRNRFEAGQEKIKHIAPSRLTDLEHMKDWLRQGYELAQEADYIGIYLNKSKTSSVREKFDPNTLVKRGVTWAASITHYGQLATIYDTKYPAPGEFDAEKPEWPLANLLDAYRMAIVEVINKQIAAYVQSEGRLQFDVPAKIVMEFEIDAPKYPGTFQQLDTAVLAAIERVEELIVSQPA